MNRKCVVEIEIIDNEDPDESTEAFIKGLHDFLMDALADLAFDVKKLEVKSQN